MAGVPGRLPRAPPGATTGHTGPVSGPQAQVVTRIRGAAALGLVPPEGAPAVPAGRLADPAWLAAVLAARVARGGGDPIWKKMAPRVGFEPTTTRLTVEGSTAELSGSNRRPKPLAEARLYGAGEGIARGF